MKDVLAGGFVYGALGARIAGLLWSGWSLDVLALAENLF